MKQIITIIKEDINKLKSNYLAISFLICTAIVVGIITALIISILSILALAIVLYIKHEFDYQKAKRNY